MHILIQKILKVNVQLESESFFWGLTIEKSRKN